MLVRGRPGDSLPASTTSSPRSPGCSATSRPSPTLITASGASSWSDTPASALEEDYRRTGRRARQVMDRLFYG